MVELRPEDPGPGVHLFVRPLMGTGPSNDASDRYVEGQLGNVAGVPMWGHVEGTG